MSKYEMGRKIKTIGQFAKSDSDLFFVRERVYHIGWIGSWQYRHIKNIIDKGIVYEARKSNERRDRRAK